jgi:hypothetical protein
MLEGLRWASALSLHKPNMEFKASECCWVADLIFEVRTAVRGVIWNMNLAVTDV